MFRDYYATDSSGHKNAARESSHKENNHESMKKHPQKQIITKLRTMPNLDGTTGAYELVLLMKRANQN